MLENMVLFIALFVAARSTGSDVTAGAAIFFFARVTYFVVYLAGVAYVRSLIWAVSLVGLVWMGLGALDLRAHGLSDGSRAAAARHGVH